MMRQYQRIKKDHPEAILFFRMGDFYEMFNQDAVTASRILEIALTSRNKNKSNAVPMCGIPYHAANAYIARLIKNGKNVAICEQTEDPKAAQGLVKREVVRVITPGTVLDDNLLDPKSHHYLAALYLDRDGFGLAALDVSTGLFKVTEFSGENAESLLTDEIDKLDPREIIVPQSTEANGGKTAGLKNQDCCLQTVEDWSFSHGHAYPLLLDHFKTQSLEGFGCDHLRKAVSAAGALIQYLRDTQKSTLDHINSISTFNLHQFMLLDQSTVHNLELVQSVGGRRAGSLLDLLDLSCTAMGARRIREWILKPLVEIREIENRQEIVEEFNADFMRREEVRRHLKQVYDLERLLGRISLTMGNARDLAALKSSLRGLPDLLELLRDRQSPALAKYTDSWDNLEDLFDCIDRMIVDDPPLNMKEGNIIKPGCDDELDRLKSVSREGKQWIASLETREKERTGIPLLKIGYNKIYGYYIEITKKNLDRVPPDYIRKQSLVNAERFVSPELKQYEEDILGAEEKIAALEHKLFQMTRERVAAQGRRIQAMAGTISEIDALLAFAEAAHQGRFSRPRISGDDTLRIENGRHPLVERTGPDGSFIPNDTLLNCKENQIMIITGPNMAGKSTYLRQVAIITLMAQIGSFVPAEQAEIGVVDRIFSRVGAQDYLLKGQSTFMVEMNETANILNNASPKSLIILDEIGRGTSTFDGISIAWSIVEYLHGPGHIGAKTLFATHYHELTDIASFLDGVKNFNIQVKEWNDEIIFLRKIAPGSADKSYGIQVARLAGLPSQVLQRAREILFNLEKNEYDEVGAPKIGRSSTAPADDSPSQLTLFNSSPNPLYQKLVENDPDTLTPRQALDLIYELYRLAKGEKTE
ncbi:MAG: DNA mismatch repair protein MutS [Nitrospinales bacterium]